MFLSGQSDADVMESVLILFLVSPLWLDLIGVDYGEEVGECNQTRPGVKQTWKKKKNIYKFS